MAIKETTTKQTSILKLITEGSNRITDLKISELGLFYLESRPQERGRSVLIHAFKPTGAREYSRLELVSKDTSVRSSVHEYGGASFLVVYDTIYFVNSADQQIYRVKIDSNHNIESSQTKITDNANSRFADIDINFETHTIVAIKETHYKKTVTNEVVVANIAAKNKYLKWYPIEQDHDFCSTPRLSPDGTKISYLVWDHPNMPWDKTAWKIADINKVAGHYNIKNRYFVNPDYKVKNYSVINTQFLDNDTLIGISDAKNGFLNPIKASLKTKRFENIITRQSDFGWPHWVFGRNMILETSKKGEYLGAYFNFKTWQLCGFDKNTITDITSELVSVTAICSNRTTTVDENYQDGIYILGATQYDQSAIYEIDLQGKYLNKLKSINLASSSFADRRLFSKSKSINLKSNSGGFLNFIYHPPKSVPENSTADSELRSDLGKPIIVQMHGGPTSMAEPGCNLTAAFFNNLSIGVAEVNYRGSSGFGREYLQSLYGNWGVYDPQDAATVAEFLIENNMASPGKIAIRGSSAGGYSTLMSISQYKIFDAAVSYYGIADLKLLAEDTHKFESQYLDRLLGASKANRSEIYAKRSPINSISHITTPLLILQGAIDPVVPKNQAELMYKALKLDKVKTQLLVFDGESHGFRMSKTIKKCLLAEVKFYSDVFGHNFMQYLK